MVKAGIAICCSFFSTGGTASVPSDYHLLLVSLNFDQAIAR